MREFRFLSVPLRQGGFVVEGVDLTRTTLHKKEDDAFGPRGMHRRFRGQRVLRSSAGDAGQCELTEATSGCFQKVAT